MWLDGIYSPNSAQASPLEDGVMESLSSPDWLRGSLGDPRVHVALFRMIWGVPEYMSHFPRRSTDLPPPSSLFRASSSPQRLSSRHQSWPGEGLLFKPSPSYLASTTVTLGTCLKTNPGNSEELRSGHLPSSWS